MGCTRQVLIQHSIHVLRNDFTWLYGVSQIQKKKSKQVTRPLSRQTQKKVVKIMSILRNNISWHFQHLSFYGFYFTLISFSHLGNLLQSPKSTPSITRHCAYFTARLSQYNQDVTYDHDSYFFCSRTLVTLSSCYWHWSCGLSLYLNYKSQHTLLPLSSFRYIERVALIAVLAWSII